MNNKVDKLFKDKLEGHSLQPSAQAWEKVEAHLGKKNKMTLWLKVAAAVMLFGVLTFVGLNRNEFGKEQVVSSKKQVVSSKEQVVSSKEPVMKPVEKRQDQVIEQPKKVELPKKTYRPVPKPAPAEVVTPVVEERPIETIALVPETSTPEIKKEKGITLTYSLPPIRKEEPVVLTEDDTKKTGLNRVLEIAREVKNSDSPLGELREAKDDIFALDFKRDKDKKRH